MRRNDRQRMNGQENKRVEKKTMQKIGKRVEHIVLRFLFQHYLSSPHRIYEFFLPSWDYLLQKSWTPVGYRYMVAMVEWCLFTTQEVLVVAVSITVPQELTNTLYLLPFDHSCCYVVNTVWNCVYNRDRSDGLEMLLNGTQALTIK